ncbi:MAG: hypothetical protein QOJ19_3945, partial [Acidimicrobiia bacterium]|nr:hypothetical protein [Acidimicrobiia bacterium]
LTVLSGLFLAATMVTLRLHDPGVV